ncbi:MAG: hypothetical protein HQL94_04430, partial [Magnetococcales bacterium]|nr:hypothetical protein [Magnetococcales bacterium]
REYRYDIGWFSHKETAEAYIDLYNKSNEIHYHNDKIMEEIKSHMVTSITYNAFLEMQKFIYEYDFQQALQKLHTIADLLELSLEKDSTNE